MPTYTGPVPENERDRRLLALQHAQMAAAHLDAAVVLLAKLEEGHRHASEADTLSTEALGLVSELSALQARLDTAAEVDGGDDTLDLECDAPGCVLHQGHTMELGHEAANGERFGYAVKTSAPTDETSQVPEKADSAPAPSDARQEQREAAPVTGDQAPRLGVPQEARDGTRWLHVSFNDHKTCLHLWARIDGVRTVPDLRAIDLTTGRVGV